MPVSGHVRAARAALCERGLVGGDLLIVTGPPGAGKSTLATAMTDLSGPSALIEGDTFFQFLRRGRIQPWLTEANDQNETVTKAAAAATGRFVADGFWTVYDGVVRPRFLPTFLRAGGLRHAHYVVLLPPVETCVERVATRTGHGFTDEAATRHMHADFARTTLDERHLIRDAHATPGELMSTVAHLVAAAEVIQRL